MSDQTDHILEISELVQEEVMMRVFAFIKDHKKHDRMIARFLRWFNSIRKCKCVCGMQEVGCECERPPRPAILPKSLMVSSKPGISHSLVLPHVLEVTEV